jgi:anti-sigma factor RsiW
MSKEHGFAEGLAAFSIGELPPTQRRELEAHVAECEGCQQQLAVDRAISEALRAATPAAPADLRAQVVATVRAAASPADTVLPVTKQPASQPASRRSRSRWRRWPIAAVAAVLLVAALLAVPIILTTREAPLPPPVNVPPPLAAAWRTYDAPQSPVTPNGQGVSQEQITNVIGNAPVAPPVNDLAVTGWGTTELAGKPAVVTEYRTTSGQRLVLFRWVGKLPARTERDQATRPAPLVRTRWGPSWSAFWNTPTTVVCLAGNLDLPAFNAVAASLHRLG